MTNEQFQAAMAVDLQEIFARNPEISQRTISEASGLGPTSLNKYLKWTVRTPKMPLATYLSLMDELNRRDALKSNHPSLALLTEAKRKPARFNALTVGARHSLKIFEYLQATAEKQKVESNLLRYYERRVPA